MKCNRFCPLDLLAVILNPFCQHPGDSIINPIGKPELSVQYLIHILKILLTLEIAGEINRCFLKYLRIKIIICLCIPFRPAAGQLSADSGRKIRKSIRQTVNFILCGCLINRIQCPQHLLSVMFPSIFGCHIHLNRPAHKPQLPV